MKNFSSRKALIISLVAVFGAGFIPFASFAWGQMGYGQQYSTRYVTAQYWCGSYYSSYPCYQQYQPMGYSYSSYSGAATQYTTYSYPQNSYYSNSQFYPGYSYGSYTNPQYQYMNSGYTSYTYPQTYQNYSGYGNTYSNFGW